MGFIESHLLVKIILPINICQEYQKQRKNVTEPQATPGSRDTDVMTEPASRDTVARIVVARAVVVAQDLVDVLAPVHVMSMLVNQQLELSTFNQQPDVSMSDLSVAHPDASLFAQHSHHVPQLALVHAHQQHTQASAQRIVATGPELVA